MKENQGKELKKNNLGYVLPILFLLYAEKNIPLLFQLKFKEEKDKSNYNPIFWKKYKIRGFWYGVEFFGVWTKQKTQIWSFEQTENQTWIFSPYPSDPVQIQIWHELYTPLVAPINHNSTWLEKVALWNWPQKESKYKWALQPCESFKNSNWNKETIQYINKLKLNFTFSHSIQKRTECGCTSNVIIMQMHIWSMIIMHYLNLLLLSSITLSK